MSAKSISIGPLLGRKGGTRYSCDFLDRSGAHADLVEAVLLKGAHALLDRDSPDLDGGGFLDRQFADLLAHQHRLVDADPALVVAVAAALAARRLVGLDVVVDVVLGERAGLQHD